MKVAVLLSIVLTAAALTLCGCLTSTSAITPGDEQLILATTTSTYDSGLLDHILPDFEKRYNAVVKVIAVGTGQAIKTGENGDADVILVHSPPDEIKFIDEGYGVDRRCVMYNDFVIIGPVDDPAKVDGIPVSDAFGKISETGSTFVSRGDDSGTHKKEISIWGISGITPSGAWYNEVGAGMGDTLRIANEKNGYTLTDRATYIAMEEDLDLIILSEGDESLLNPYGVMRVDATRHPHIKEELGKDFEDWLMSEETQGMIEGYRKNAQQLFFPLKGECIGG